GAVIPSAILRLSVLRSAGRIFGEAIGSLGPEAAASFNRWANAWRLHLSGAATAETLATLKHEADLPLKQLQKLPDAEQYEAAMALFSRMPRTIALDAALMAKLLRLSVRLEPAREQLVVKVAQALHQEINGILKREADGQTLSLIEQDVLPHINSLKSLLGSQYDDFITELSREGVRSLKKTAGSQVAAVAGQLNAIQGAVGQIAFFRTAQFRLIVASKLKDIRLLVRQELRRRWTTAAITEGRIYLAIRTKNGRYMIREYVDGAIVSYEKVASERLAKGFVGFGAQVKVEEEISGLAQTLQDELRRTSGWGSSDSILLIPSGGGSYRALQMVPPPLSITPERMLIAAEGGRWPLSPELPASVAKTIKAEAPLTRD